MKKNVIIVSGSNHKFFPILQGLVLSVRRARAIADLPMAVLDVGLTDEDRTWLAAQDVSIVHVDWDFAFLASYGMPEFFKVLTWRPFLPKHLPDAEIYVWMDADAWVQDEQGVLLAIDCAAGGAIAIVPEIHSYYRTMYEPPHEVRKAELKIYQACYGDETANSMISKPLINAGFFALAKDSDGWSIWADVLRTMYERPCNFYTEQCSLNFCIYARGMRCVPLPAYCNWICCHRLPAFDEKSGRLVEPGPPHQDIWIVHLAGRAKEEECQLETIDGKTITRSLRYPN